MVLSKYFVYVSAYMNPRIKVPLFLDSTQGGLLKNVQNHFSIHLGSRKIAKKNKTSAHFFLKHLVCIFPIIL